MILAAIGALTLLASLVMFWRRAVEMRVIRWELYALRDHLRHLAYETPELLSSAVFQTLDRILTSHSAHLNDISLWSILPQVLFADRDRIEGRQRDFQTRPGAMGEQRRVRLLVEHLYQRVSPETSYGKGKRDVLQHVLDQLTDADVPASDGKEP